MPELTCTHCGASNALAEDQAASAARCIRCAHPLDAEAELRYYIAQGAHIQGPYLASRVRELIAEQQVRPDMQFSLEGGAWRPGPECPELFPAPAAEQDVPAPPPPLPPPLPPLGQVPGTPSEEPRSERHYSTDAPPPTPVAPSTQLRPHRGTLILVLGICSLFCFLPGIIAWVLANEDLEAMKSGAMDRSGEGNTSAGRILGIVGIGLWALVTVMELG